MKIIKLLLPLVMICLMLISCGDANLTNGNTTIDPHTYYEVTFDSRGGSAVSSQRVMENNPIARPINPTYDGHSFMGWYTTPSANEDTIWSFDTDRVVSDMVLYASWLEESAEEEPTESLTYTRTEDGYEVTGVGDEERIIIPEVYDNVSVTSIGASAFARKQITYVSIPDSVTSIGLNAFNNASRLKEVRIGTNSNLTTIANNAFSGNSSLESIYLPAKLVSLGNSVFNNASSLNSIVVASGNTHYYSTGNNLIETSTETLIRGSNNSAIPNGVRTIASAAFRRSSIEKITIPASVEAIENYVFDDCRSLKEINVDLANNYFSSQSGVLYDKEQSTLLVVPEGADSNIILPDSITEIPSFAFDGIDTIKAIYLPIGVNSIRSFAFRGVTANIYYAGSEDEWNRIEKHSTWGGGSLNISYNASSDDIIDSISIYTIFFSATSNTKGIANMIQAYTNSSIYEITALVPYTSADLAYSNSSCRANIEQNDPNSRPEIGSEAIDLSDYDVIYLGYPIWWGKAPKIIYTFLEAYDLSGKVVIPFCTSGSSSISGSISDLKNLEPNATWIDGQRFSASANASTIQNWIDSLNY